jgi:hypothetical protein
MMCLLLPAGIPRSPAGGMATFVEPRDSREARVALLDDIAMHAPGCQCHGCGASSLTGMMLGSQQVRLGSQAPRLRPSDSPRRQFGAVAAPTTDYAFEMAASSIRYGRGVTAEVGMDMENLGCAKVMVLTDKNIAKLPVVSTVLDALRNAGRQVELFDRVEVEPTDTSFQDAIDFAKVPQPLTV